MIKELINSIHPISINSLKEIERILEYKIVKKGETFIKRNRKNKKEYFILEGICRSYLTNPQGEEITITFFTSNSVLSPHSIRTINETSVLNFQALTTVKFAAMDALKFEQLMVDKRDIRRFGNTVMRNELARKVDKEIGLVSLTAKERLLKFRAQYPLLENLIPHPIIASYLGITNISLSRIRGDLAR